MQMAEAHFPEMPPGTARRARPDGEQALYRAASTCYLDCHGTPPTERILGRGRRQVGAPWPEGRSTVDQIALRPADAAGTTAQALAPALALRLVASNVAEQQIASVRKLQFRCRTCFSAGGTGGTARGREHAAAR
jgi:hypothetical protein